MIFVFGSNKQGIHGAGAALYAAQNEGAKRGIGEGRSGNSYALPTRSYRNGVFKTLSDTQIKENVERFILYAKQNPDQEFLVTAIGTGHAGIPSEIMASMFSGAPSNCFFDQQWEYYLPEGTKFWGTY